VFEFAKEMVSPQPIDYCAISRREKARLVVVLDTEEGVKLKSIEIAEGGVFS
jgi:hypothetical protein